MTHSEIDTLCAVVAQETGLPVSWVRHHVDQRAGRPCRRCGGAGTVAGGSCFRCKGSGGKAQPSTVSDALTWVRDNVSRVRVLGEARGGRVPDLARERAHKRAVQAEAWKRDHYEEWRLVEDMLPCNFKSSIVKAIDEGSLTEKQAETLKRMADFKKRKEVVAPAVGARVETRAVLNSARHELDGRGAKVFRIEFEVGQGWRGRIDTTDEGLITRVQSRRSDAVTVSGVVSWQRGGFAILAGRVEVG